MKKPMQVVAIGVATVVSLGALAGCQGGGSAAEDEAGPVTITVGDYPSAEQEELRANWDDKIAAFEKANPNITIETDTYVYAPDTFAAGLAGGTLPDVYNVPFTEPQSMIRAGQAADVTAALKEIGIYEDLNPDVLSAMSDADGNVFGIPVLAYAIGINYNRALFEQAGLDPNSPPRTFEELRSTAKTITDKTGVPGFAMFTSNTGGGWNLTQLTAAFGGTIENADGTASALNEGATLDALQFIRGLQDDGSLGNNLLLDVPTSFQEFAAGKFAMYPGLPAWYDGAVINFGMNPDDFASGPMPSSADADATLTGGGAAVVNPNSSPAEVLAASKWISFYYLTREESEVVDTAKAAAADGLSVGIPSLSLFKENTAAQIADWISPYVNVPVGNFDPYVETVSSKTLVAEPPVKAQDVYTLLDSLVQAVVGDPNSDIPALVDEYDGKLNELLSR